MIIQPPHIHTVHPHAVTLDTAMSFQETSYNTSFSKFARSPESNILTELEIEHTAEELLPWL